MDLQFSQELLNRLLDNVNQLNHDYTSLATSVAVLESQMVEVIWMGRLIIGGIIMAILGQVWHIIIAKKNGKR